jgi:uroporphyrinogen decarboxylase
MRQAGRFLHEYRAVRERAGSFRNMISNPDLAAEVTLQPVELIGVDAAIIFSDILVVPEAMGLPYDMAKGEGPVFNQTVRDEGALLKLKQVEGRSNLDDTFEAIKLVKRDLGGRVPLIGFAGAPWTIFCYMTEGGSSKTYSLAKKMLYTQPDFSHRLLQKITDTTIQYLKGQIQSGVDIVQVFDSWAGLLSREAYQTFALPYLEQIAEAIRDVPVILFPKGAGHCLDLFSGLPCAAVGLDWTTEPELAATCLPQKALQGNMDPSELYANPDVVYARTTSMLDRFPKGRHIANLGHGIAPDLPRESVMAFVQAVKDYRYNR